MTTSQLEDADAVYLDLVRKLERNYRGQLAHHNPDHASRRRTPCQEAFLVENSESIYEKQTHIEYTAQKEESHPVVVANNLRTWSSFECGKQRGVL